MVPYLHTNLLSIALPVFLLLLQTFLWQPPVIRGSLSFPEPVRPALLVSPTVRVQLLHPHQPWGLLITFVPGCCVEPVWWRNSPSFHRLIISRVCEWMSILCLFLLVFLTEGNICFESPGPSQEPKYHPYPAICVRRWSFSRHCKKLSLFCYVWSSYHGGR